MHDERPYAPALIKLLQGIVYQDDEATWNLLRGHEHAVRAYYDVIGLVLHLSDADGYAFLRQSEEEESTHLPRITRRMPLNYPTTLLCVLLRERLLQHDAGGIDSPRLIVSREDMVEAMLPFFKEKSDETRSVAVIHRAVERLAAMGFLTPLKTDEDAFEVRRILKAHVTADKLSEIKAVLEAHVEEPE